MKRKAWIGLAGLLVATSGSCRKKSEPSEVPLPPVAQIVRVEPEKPEVHDLTPPPAVPPAEEAMPDEEEPSAPDTDARQ